MEIDSTHNDVPQMIERLIILEVNMKTILNTDLHLHRHHLGCSLHLIVRQKHSKVLLFDYTELTSHNDSNEIADATSDSIESLVLFFEVRELKLV